MSMTDLKQIAERALRMMRVVEDLPLAEKAEVMSIAQAMMRVEAQRAMRPAPQPEVRDE